MDLLSKLIKNETYFLISGPCVIEDDDIMFKIAEFLKKETQKRNIPFVFKASYQKANRTSVHSYSGPGLEKGLKLLQKIKTDFEVPILTDIHESHEVEAVSEVADIIQIPAFLSRQTFLIQKAAQSGKIINIKKGQFMAPEDMQAAIHKITSQNNYNIMLTERGTSFGYHNLVVDFRSFPIMKGFNFPVVYDVTHSLQKPSLQNISGGSPEFAPMMAKAAMATEMIDGLFIETHPHPQEALSDSASMINLETVPVLLDDCLRIKNSFKDRK